MPPVLAGQLIQDTIMSGARVLIAGGANDAKSLAEVTLGVRMFLLGGLGYSGFADA